MNLNLHFIFISCRADVNIFFLSLACHPKNWTLFVNTLAKDSNLPTVKEKCAVTTAWTQERCLQRCSRWQMKGFLKI